MKFEHTGLIKDAVVEEAFNYAQTRNKTLVPEVLQQLEKQLDGQYQQKLSALDDAHDAGYITDAQYEENKTRLDISADAQRRNLPMIAEQQLAYLFGRVKVSLALELQNNSDKATPTLIAAALLLDCVRDPMDYKKVEDKFGSAVGGLIAEILHIESYPATAKDARAKAGADAKRIFMAELAAELNQISNQLAMMAPGSMAELPPKYEEKFLEEAKTLWGNDKKQDKRLLESFNRAAKSASSPFRLELDAAGAPALVDASALPPPPGQKKNPKITWGGNKP